MGYSSQLPKNALITLQHHFYVQNCYCGDIGTFVGGWFKLLLCQYDDHMSLNIKQILVWSSFKDKMKLGYEIDIFWHKKNCLNNLLENHCYQYMKIGITERRMFVLEYHSPSQFEGEINFHSIHFCINMRRGCTTLLLERVPNLQQPWQLTRILIS